MTTKPRDYRDDADVDEALDTIRVSDRAEAKALLLAILDCAHQQGICEGVDKCIARLRSTLKP